MLFSRLRAVISRLNLWKKYFLSFFVLFCAAILSWNGIFYRNSLELNKAQMEESFHASVLNASNEIAGLLSTAERDLNLLIANNFFLQTLESFDRYAVELRYKSYLDLTRTIHSVESVNGNRIRISIPVRFYFLNDMLHFFYQEDLWKIGGAGHPRNREWSHSEIYDFDTGQVYSLHYSRPLQIKMQKDVDWIRVGVGVQKQSVDMILTDLNMIMGGTVRFLTADEEINRIGGSSGDIETVELPELPDTGDSATREINEGGHIYLQIVQKVPGYDLYLVADTSLQQFYKNLTRVFVNHLAVSALLIAMAFFVVYMISKMISTRLRLLAGHIDRYRLGEAYVPIMDRQNDDISKLTESFNTMAVKINELVEEVYIADLSHKETQIKLLQAQINPHFLYNTLNLIQCMALEGDVDSVSDLTVRLSQFLRYTVKSEPMQDISMEIDHAMSYLRICQYRYGKRIYVHLGVDETVSHIPVPSITLQPIVENAILYGLPDAGSLTISIDAYMEDDLVYIRVADDGKGMDRTRLEEIYEKMKDTGRMTGLGNVQQRVRLMCGEDYGLSILSEEGKGTTCVLTLPYA